MSLNFFVSFPSSSYQFNEGERLETSIAAGVDWQRFSPGRQKLNFTKQRYSWRSEYRKKFSPRYELALGTDFIYERFHNEVRASEGFFDEDDLRTPLEATKLLITEDTGEDWQQCYYVSNRIGIIQNKLTLTPNLRLDYFALHEQAYLQPRGGVIYQVNEAANVYFNTGLYYQP